MLEISTFAPQIPVPLSRPYRIVLTVGTVLWDSYLMAINLPPDIERSVRRHLSSGQFQTAEDVLRAALHQFDEMDLGSLRDSMEDETAGRSNGLAEDSRRFHPSEAWL